ncbi:MAG TPA: tetratricopeptide repeat protein [Kofleriaceae bacterium]|nr:tetratricopeptide repeat protein [Kofleriaceae bacterium]
MGFSRAIAAVVSCALCSPAAFAQPTPSEAQRQQASGLVKKAITKSQAGDHEAAIELYLQAYAMIPNALLLSNIGTEFEQESKPVEALKYFCKYLEADPTGSNVGYATAKARTLQIQLGNTVDEKDVCKAPSPKPKPPEPPPPVTTTTTAPPEGEPPQVTGTTNLGEPEQPRPSRTLEYAGLAVGGAGAIAAGVGVYYMLKGKSLSDQISHHKQGDPWPSSIDGVPIGQWDQAGHDDNVRAAAFGIPGGVALAAGTVMFLLGRPKATPTGEHVSIAPVATPSSIGLSLSGGF